MLVLYAMCRALCTCKQSDEMSICCGHWSCGPTGRTEPGEGAQTVVLLQHSHVTHLRLVYGGESCKDFK